MSSDATLWDDSFQVTLLDNARYDRVGRISGKSTDSLSDMTLDVNTDLYPISVGETVQMLLASTLNLDGTKDDEKGWRDTAKRDEITLAQQYDYVCYGKVYRFEEGKDDPEKIQVFVSFGGLLLYINGPYKKLTPLRVDHVYLLMKK